MGKFLKVVPFTGMFPRVAERLLQDGASVDASNLVISSGEVRPIKQSQLAYLPSGSGPWLAVYRAEWNGSQKWMAWNTDVDVARIPSSSDVEPRYFVTGNGEPSIASFTNFGSSAFAVGIPKPTVAPTVSTSGGTGTTVSRVYVYTYFSASGEESAWSPANAILSGKVDGTWTISGMEAFPANSGAVTASYAGGVTTFTNSGSHWLRAGDLVTISAVQYTVASVPTNSSFTVAANLSGAVSWARVNAWNTSGMKRRLYRSAGTNATYQLVNDNVGTSYTDTLTDSQIMGDTLISSTWIPPLPGLKGIIALPSGAMAGFVGNQLCYSEPYQPHAWPAAYRFGADHEIVGIESFGTTVVAATAGKPYVSNGIEPASSTLDSVDQVWPCLSKRSIVSVGDGVMYATYNGMAYIGSGGSSIWTTNYFTKIEWTPKDPSSMVSAMSEGKIFVRFSGSDGSKGVMVFDPETANSGMLLLSEVPDELYTDPRNGKLYTTNSTGVYQYDSKDGSKLPYSWKSKEYYLGEPTNFGAGHIDFVSEMTQTDYDAAVAAYNTAKAANVGLVSGYQGFGAINGGRINRYAMNASNVANIALPNVSSVTFTLFCDEKLVYSRNLVAGSGRVRLPSGFKASTIQVQLTGTTRVKHIYLADTPSSLKAVP